jgi:hypothetical protein
VKPKTQSNPLFANSGFLNRNLGHDLQRPNFTRTCGTRRPTTPAVAGRAGTFSKRLAKSIERE